MVLASFFVWVELKLGVREYGMRKRSALPRQCGWKGLFIQQRGYLAHGEEDATFPTVRVFLVLACWPMCGHGRTGQRVMQSCWCHDDIVRLLVLDCAECDRWGRGCSHLSPSSRWGDDLILPLFSLTPCCSLRLGHMGGGEIGVTYSRVVFVWMSVRVMLLSLGLGHPVYQEPVSITPFLSHRQAKRPSVYASNLINPTIYHARKNSRSASFMRLVPQSLDHATSLSPSRTSIDWIFHLGMTTRRFRRSIIHPLKYHPSSCHWAICPPRTQLCLPSRA
jgi:hypothetical protein